MSIMSNFLFWGALMGAFAVVLGAFGAHGLKARLTPEMMQVYQTAVEYHFYHVGALLVVGLLVRMLDAPCSWLYWGGAFFLVGMLLFSGSLYALAISGVKILGAITPIGGVCFILGWLCLAMHALACSSKLA